MNPFFRPQDGKTTGYLANDSESYARAMLRALSLSEEERIGVVGAARGGVGRFNQETFNRGFGEAFEALM